MIGHTRQAELGSWALLQAQGCRLQILGKHEKVLNELPALRTRMTDLLDKPVDDYTTDLWRARELILSVGCWSAIVLCRWEEALDLNDEVIASQQDRGVSSYDVAYTQFCSNGPLISLGRWDDVDRLLRDCQKEFEAARDTGMLAKVFGARANLEYERGHSLDAVGLQRIALRLKYIHSNGDAIAASHYNLARYLSSTVTDPAEQRAHRLAATLLTHLTGNTHFLDELLRVLATELPGDSSGPDAPALPTALLDVIRLVDTGEGVHFGDLVAALCPDPDAATMR